MATKDTQATAAPQEKPLRPNVVELDTPIKRGNTEITEVELRKPVAGDLRGVTLTDLLNTDVNALRKVLPRITTPALTDHEIGFMDPADLMEIGAKVGLFLLRKSVKAELSLPA